MNVRTKAPPKPARSAARPFMPRRTVDLPLFRSAANYARFRRLVAALFGIGAHLTTIRRQVAENFRLGLSHHQILTAVAERQGMGGVSVRDLAEYMQVSGPFIAAESKVLAERGLLIKVDDPADRRRSLLQLSISGERYVDEVADLIRPVNNLAFASLDAERLALLECMLEELLHDAEAAEALLHHK